MPAKFDKSALFKALSVSEKKPVEIAGFGTVFVKAMTIKDQEMWESSMLESDGRPKGREDVSLTSAFLVQVVVDERGNRVFNESDIPQLDASKAGPLKKLFTVAQSLNGFDTSDIEQAEKN